MDPDPPGPLFLHHASPLAPWLPLLPAANRALRPTRHPSLFYHRSPLKTLPDSPQRQQSRPQHLQRQQPSPSRQWRRTPSRRGFTLSSPLDPRRAHQPHQPTSRQSPEACNEPSPHVEAAPSPRERYATGLDSRGDSLAPPLPHRRRSSRMVCLAPPPPSRGGDIPRILAQR